MYRRYDKVVAFGAGGMMSMVHERLPFQLDYLVDNDPNKHGTLVQGRRVFHPNQLLEESSPERVLVIVFSWFYRDIYEQIKRMGEFNVVSAGIIMDYRSFYLHEKLQKTYLETESLRRNPKSKNAIVIQGPVVKGMTEQIAKYYGVFYPNDHIILSTWIDSEAESLNEITQYVDHIVLSKQPSIPGSGHRNSQAKNTYAGIEKANELGANRVLKVRTDMLSMRTNLFDAMEHRRSLFRDIPTGYDVEDRIVIPQSFTSKYLMYAVSDMIMYGNTRDMLRFWDVPIDERGDFSTWFDDPKRISLYDFSLQSGFPEIYFGRQYANKIGRKVQDSLSDSHRFIRDFFLILDDTEWNMMWFKNFQPIESMFYDTKPSKMTIDHAFWLSVGQGYTTGVESEGHVNLHKTFL